ncbi:hypothetical protein AKJ08_1152 [Vulgatibacter incomptus]|uniref:Uncharacterized protein n=1 Tax=Vulgatibacter incomptus TaxID=1391653 RepID=A0A0K1PB72_9BACT|nr:hypothetical protein AKJ08_1152 [Vulgatibacter incomptus]
MLALAKQECEWICTPSLRQDMTNEGTKETRGSKRAEYRR